MAKKNKKEKIENFSKVPIPEFVKESEKVSKAKIVIPYLFFINKFFLFFTSITCIYIVYIFYTLPAPTLIASFDNGIIRCTNKYYDPNTKSLLPRETSYYENYCLFLDKRSS